jgi:hypothetical protein
MPSDLMETDMALPVFPRCRRCYQLTSSRTQARITPQLSGGAHAMSYDGPLQLLVSRWHYAALLAVLYGE